MTVTPYLFFKGDCADALTTYARIFGSPAPELMTAGSMPGADQLPPGSADKIMHGTVHVGATKVYASDDFDGTTPPMAGSSVMADLPTAAAARAVFDALAEGGEVQMPFEATFWSAGFGSLTDRFGIRWMVGADEPPAQD